MRRNLIWSVLLGLLLAVAGGAVIYELWDSPLPSTTSVDASAPIRPDELAHVDGGFSWTATRGGSPLFELLAASGVVVEGGVEFLREIDSLRLHLKDGGWVTLHAPAGRIEGRGGEGNNLRLFLEGGVTAQDPSGALLAADSIAYDFSTGMLAATGPANLTRGDSKTRLQSFDYDTNSKRLVTHGPLQVDFGPLGYYRLETADAVYQLESGDVEFTRPVRVVGEADGLEIIAWRGHAQLAKPDRGQSLTLEGPLLLSDRSQGSGWSLAGARLETVPSPVVGAVTIHGPVTCLMRTQSSDGVQLGDLRTQLMKIEPSSDGGHVVTASNGFEADLERDGSSNERVEIVGTQARLVVPGRNVQSFQATGRVLIKGMDGVTAEGNALQWDAGAAELISLEGALARATQVRDSVEAPRLVFDRKRASLFAEGPVTSEISPRTSNPGAIFRAGEPLRIRSQRLTMPQRDGWTVFDGPVQAWQEDTKLQAKSLRYDRQKELLEAEGEVRITKNLQDDDGSARSVRLSAQSLRYDSPKREVRLNGDAHYQEEPGIRLIAKSMFVHLGEKETIESLNAQDDVKLDSRGTRGTADRLEWTGGAKGVALLFGTKGFATLQSADSPPLRGQRLKYDLATQQFTADGGSGKTVIEGQTPAPSAEKKP
ncbi:MAG: LptA/OstA family protein [Acidobacteriota bacterium]